MNDKLNLLTKMDRTIIVAEAGVNHNGEPDLAFRLIDIAVEAGVDVVKFQTFNAGDIVTKGASKVDYQKKNIDDSESQYSMLKRLELDCETYYKLISYCKEQEIEFLSTAFDFKSLNFLVNDLGLKTLKISSSEITNGPLLLAHARTGCDLIISTGMATLSEVEEALSVLAFGLINGMDLKIKPSRDEFQKAYSSVAGQQALRNRVTVLHCTTEYPAPPKEINLNAMLTMRNVFGLKTGYSDHSKGITVPIAAVAMGATLIEKHFTIDKSLSGPDHKASLNPSELKDMVKAIRNIEQAMGDGIKLPMPSELKNRSIIRKSLVASIEIKKGDFFSEHNIVAKRPDMGISPMEYWDLYGSVSHKSFNIEDIIER